MRLKTKKWSKKLLPNFASEAEEAEFWYTHKVAVRDSDWQKIPLDKYAHRAKVTNIKKPNNPPTLLGAQT